jgi:hypothetical protein
VSTEEYRRRKFALTLVFAFLASVATPYVCHAEPPDALPPDVIVIVHPLEKAGEVFRQVVTDAARNALETRGLVAALPERSPSDTPMGGDIVGLARQLKAAVALDCVYSIDQREIIVTVGWFDAATGARAAHAEGRGAVDLRLDGVIFDVVNSVLATVDGQVRQLKAAREEAMAARAAAEKAAASLEDSRMAATEESAQAAGKPGTRGITGAGAPAQTPSSMQMLLSVSLAPFIATGAASYYFTLGFFPSILASLVFTTPSGRIGVGLSAGMDYFPATGPSDTSNNFMLPLGVDLRYELAGPRFLFFLHLAGGPAALLILTGSHQFFVNVMPFIRSGIGAEILLSPRLGISISADYEIYFEMPYLLMGFAPALGMTFRL